MADLLRDLNEEQFKAVTHRGGPLMIVAGAGTGKTTVITQRIAWLIEQGLAKPENILALTFTDKAAGEMEERVDMLLPMGYVELQISTFHAFCEKLLREYGAEMGLSRDFRVLTELDGWLLARQHLDQFPLDYFRPLGNPTKYLRGLLSHFSRAKDEGVMPDQYVAFAEALAADKDSAQADGELGEPARVLELANCYAAYQKLLLDNDALDFGDLLVYALKLLRERPAVLKAVRARYTWVLVDEFQDTNHVQYELVKLIAAPVNNLTVVGDDDQAIYRFRGASIANILEFDKDYAEATKIVLTRNYRSVQTILDRSHEFIQANNPNRLEAQNPKLVKRLLSHKEGTGVIEHIHGSTLEDEVEAVTSKMLGLKEALADVSWSDFAILVRANDAALPFVAALERRKIPYQFLALRGLYAKPVIMDMTAWLHVIDNPFESPSFYRVLNLDVHGITPQAIAELTHLANRKGKSLVEACRMAHAMTKLTPEELGGIDAVLSKLDAFRREAAKRKASELFVLVARESGYIEWLNKQSDRAKQDAFRHLQQFLERIKRFEAQHDDPALRHFLAEFRVERDAGEEGSLAADLESGPDTVRIMTVHASKGLEFRFVFVVNLVDRRFPAQARAEAIPLPDGLVPDRLAGADWHLEEERRLFYVAMTRAKEGLYFTSADDYGGTRARKLSRFLAELKYEKPVSKELAQDPFGDEKAPDIEETEAGLVIHIPKQFSFTQLVAFRTCPLQYKFAHVFKIPIFGKWTFSFGKTMHNTLQRFFTVWVERTGAVQTSLFAPSTTLNTPTTSTTLPVSLDELLEMYADCWQDDWYRDDKERETYRKEGKEQLVAYYKGLVDEKPEPLTLEAPFMLKIGDVILKGRIDRIDKCGDGIEIIDYKTGTPKEDGKLSKEDKEQLVLYQLAAIDVLGLKPVKLTFHYLKDNSRVSFIGDEEELAELRESIVERVGAIRRGLYPPTPGFHCKFCDFADICEFRQR